MRIGNVGGRLTIVTDAGGIDVETASRGLFNADPADVFARWAAFRAWAKTLGGEHPPIPIEESTLGAPSPRPAQVFAIGLNYGAHAVESGYDVPEVPITFTKFPSCITGPYGELIIAGNCVDWEVELVAVIGETARDVAVDEAWHHIAGLTIGQDYSER